MLRSSVREFLVSEAMHALHVPTTRALSLVLTGQKIRRPWYATTAQSAQEASMNSNVMEDTSLSSSAAAAATTRDDALNRGELVPPFPPNNRFSPDRVLFEPGAWDGHPSTISLLSQHTPLLPSDPLLSPYPVFKPSRIYSNHSSNITPPPPLLLSLLH